MSHISPKWETARQLKWSRYLNLPGGAVRNLLAAKVTDKRFSKTGCRKKEGSTSDLSL
jgi:hypothetical protein